MKRIAGAVALIFLPHIVLAEGLTGLFISHKNSDVDAYQQWVNTSRSTFESHNCVSFRSGTLAGGEGALKWGDSDHFSLIKCQSPVLADLIEKGFIGELSSITDNLNLIEGNLNILSDKMPSEKSEYLIKVSYFNNLNTKARQKSLAKIGLHARKAERAWIDDAILQPRASVGVIQPDDMTFLYYPESGQGKSFRENNPELMNEIGRFNRIHVERVTYLAAQIKDGGMK